MSSACSSPSSPWSGNAVRNSVRRNVSVSRSSAVTGLSAFLPLNSSTTVRRNASSARSPAARASSTAVAWKFSGKRADRSIPFAALFEQRLDVAPAQLVELGNERATQRFRGGRVIVVRAARRLGHDRIDDAEAQQVRRGDLHRFRRLGAAPAVLPQDAGGG